MRSIILPPSLIREYLRLPLLRDLLVTRIGYCSRASGHYIPRPEGSMDHIVHYCVGGKGWLRVAGQQWSIEADTAFFLPHDVPHTYGADSIQPWSLYWIHFTGLQADDYFEILNVSARQPLLHVPCADDVLSVFRVIESHMNAVHTRANLVAASGALAWFLSLLQLRRFAAKQRERSIEENIQRSIAFMQANLTKPVSLRELAQLAHLSLSRYEAAFAKQTGSSPISYFNRMRIQRACRLLTETNLPIKAICVEIGCEDPYYFSRLFKKIVGVSPLYFRRSSTPLANPSEG